MSEAFPLITASAIAKAYAEEPDRKYYTPFYVQTLLDGFDIAKQNITLEHPEYMEFALWLSRIRYIRGINDDSSCSVATFWLNSMGAPKKVVAQVVRFIKLGKMAVKPHFAKLSDDEKVMWDIYHYHYSLSNDSVLGDEMHIRDEVPDVVDKHYRQSRGDFLMRLKLRMYRSDYFYNTFEQRASENIHFVLQNFAQVMLPRSKTRAA
jgi:predicted metal-dependent HD superfamily phosphohydrolase